MVTPEFQFFRWRDSGRLGYAGFYMRYDSDFVIHCKPNGLCEIVGALKGAQEEDVKAVGFGGMLRISGISVTKTDLIRWLVERFNGRSQMLTISNRIFIPIWIAEHFFAVVVNLVEQKVQNLDNMMPSKLKINIQKTVKSQMAIFLEEKEHPKGGDIEQYVVEDVRFAWKGCAGANGVVGSS
ncbi:hypothetical protein CASFOL_030500 [Castilleja foliolosa]|uniref:Uncharacterized protein n=1 Tax=Castilleja foliolosa TaxID=1961234 RepID=A0ABD3C963_9LAMI